MFYIEKLALVKLSVFFFLPDRNTPIPTEHAHTPAHILHDHKSPSPRPDRHTASVATIRASSLVYSL